MASFIFQSIALLTERFNLRFVQMLESKKTYFGHFLFKCKKVILVECQLHMMRSDWTKIPVPVVGMFSSHLWSDVLSVILDGGQYQESQKWLPWLYHSRRRLAAKISPRKLVLIFSSNMLLTIHYQISHTWLSWLYCSISTITAKTTKFGSVIYLHMLSSTLDFSHYQKLQKWYSLDLFSAERSPCVNVETEPWIHWCGVGEKGPCI